jgi:four helix bundle protein
LPAAFAIATSVCELDIYFLDVEIHHALHVREARGLSKGRRLRHEVAALTEGFPRGYGFLVDQLNRAALSIATNLAEGNGRFTKPDRRNFFTIARGSAQECIPLIKIARRRGLVKEPDAVALKERLEVIARMISGLINGLEKSDG